jgi:Zn-dependent oligopeptidase
LQLDEETRNEVKQIKTKISELETKFNSNINEENTVLNFSVEELAGVPQDLVDSFEKV